MTEGNPGGKGRPVLAYGMVGGGEGAFIGDVHRKAIALDGSAQLVAGCFSRSRENTLSTGRSLGLDDDRLYGSFAQMARSEAARTDGIAFVVVVTPNNSHFPIAKAFLEAGISVVCDKPLATDSKQAVELAELAGKKDLLFVVTYTYSGYPAVKHAKEIIAAGDIGRIRFINAEYAQEWLAGKLEDTGQKQASWRSDPSQSGVSNCVGDIGSHIENTVSYMTGLKISRLSARLDTFVEGRVLDDNACILVDYEGGAKGLYWSSQIAVGHNNDLSIRIYGSKGTVRWRQEEPDRLELIYPDRPAMTVIRGRDGLANRAQNLVRVPAGHPEGYFEAMANLYKTFAAALAKKASGARLTRDDLDFPKAEDGAAGVKFIETCVASSRKDGAWQDM